MVELFFNELTMCFIRQKKEWGEIFLGIEGKNQYEVLDSKAMLKGSLIEEAKGVWRFFSRIFLRSHRPLNVSLYNRDNRCVLKLYRPFFWFFSDLNIYDNNGIFLGCTKRRFSFFYKKYDLIDRDNKLFAHIKSGLWRIWKFPIFDLKNNQIGVIQKEWGGFLKEIFSDADQFGVEFPKSSSSEQKALYFATSISIDFDYFEENTQKSGTTFFSK